MVIHILHQGQSLCGMSGAPNQWPQGHVWIGTEVIKKTKKTNPNDLCSQCISKAPKKREK